MEHYPKNFLERWVVADAASAKYMEEIGFHVHSGAGPGMCCIPADSTLDQYGIGDLVETPWAQSLTTWEVEYRKHLARVIKADADKILQEIDRAAAAAHRLGTTTEQLQARLVTLKATREELLEKEQARIDSLLDPNLSAGISANLIATTFHFLQWRKWGRQYYVLDNTTAQALADTDVDDIPLKMIKPPVDCFYLAAPEWLRLFRVEHRDTLQQVDGFTVQFGRDVSGEVVEFNACFGSKGTREVDDAVMWFNAPLKKNGIQKVGDFRAADHLDPVTGTRAKGCLKPSLTEGGVSNYAEGAAYEVFDATWRFVAGVCLYLASAHPAIAFHDPAPAPSRPRTAGGKAAKLWRRHDRLTDVPVTYVGAPHHGHQRSESGPSGRLVRPHVRRGHFRAQAVGPRTLGGHRTIWIRPTLVGNWDKLASASALKVARGADRHPGERVEDLRDQGEL